ncbi:MAG: hypothetical protein KKE73_04370 [Proteobacteria bacterium]|nr:hypothetical protein [Pseudomonadota bacterium]
MNNIHSLTKTIRAVALALPMAILLLTLCLTPAFAADNYANTTSTLNGNWV